MEFLVQKLRSFFLNHSKEKAVVGVSGGLDSSVVAVLANKSLGQGNVKFCFLPSKYTSQLTRDCLHKLSEKFGIIIQEIPFVVDRVSNIIMETLYDSLAIGEKILDKTRENIQARARMIYLMGVCNQTNALLLNCANKSEILTGYCTLYGDTAGAVAPIAHLYKTEVYKLGERLGIPKIILERSPTAELGINQLDSDVLPKYDLLDELLQVINLSTEVENICTKSSKELTLVLSLIKNNSFKRKQFPPSLIE